MSVNFPQLKEGIFTWLATVLAGTEVAEDRIFFRNPNAPRPPRPCVGIEITAGPGQIHHDQRIEVSSGVYNVEGHRRITVSVIAYGEKSDEISGLLHSSCETEKALQIFRKYGLGLIRQEDIIDVTALLDTRYEARHQFDVMFHVVSSASDSVGWVENVELTNETNGSTDIVGP